MDFKLSKSNLNFSVYTASALPTTGKENDICVVSDVPMKNWILSPDKPSGTPRNDGDVWITYSTAGNVVNVFNTNSLMVHSVSAKQYCDGVWKSVTAKSYRGGLWVDWVLYLYNHGDECIDITGGWTCKSWQMSAEAGSATQTYDITKNDDKLTFTKTGQVGAVMHTVNKIDLTNVKTIHFRGEMVAGGSNANWAGFYVWPDLGGRYWNSNAATKTNGTGNDTVTEFALDVSSIPDGEYYVGFGIYDPKSRIVLEELYMEVEL